MAIVLQRVLEPEDLERLHAGLGAAAWRSGKRSAGAAARKVKENLQADSADPSVEALQRFVLEALSRHPLFEIAARPAKISRLIFSKYQPGMTYGAHTDDALMGAGEGRLRTDLAFTIFLSPPTAYEGGALVVESPLGEQEIKLEAGDAILYPAGSIHHVAPVMKGERLAAIGWVQSCIADNAQREILFDLSIARARLAEAGTDDRQALLLDKAISNLLRMWAR